MRALLGIAAVTVLVGCTSRSHTVIYTATEPPRLVDGTVTMFDSDAGSEDVLDVRRVRSRDGSITCEFIARGGQHLVGRVPESDWVELWNVLIGADPFGGNPYGRTPPDPDGGTYHLIRLELGSRSARFSTQFRRNLLVFSSVDVVESLEYSNAIVSLVSTHAKTPIQDAPWFGPGLERPENLREGPAPDP